MSHTPGPWTAKEPNGRGNGWRVGPAWLGHLPTNPADAYLIGASPDLLEACEALLVEAKQFFPTVSGEAIALGEAAIKKARGGG